jgi:hypothetical protein
MVVSMSPSGGGTPSLGRSEQCMASRDNDEQLPSNNDTASSSNGTTSNLLSLSSNNLNTRRVFGVMSNNDDNIALTSTSTS